MRTFVLITFCLCLFIESHAQKNYQPGYVIKTNGDTIKGFINYRAWDRSPRAIDFKKSNDEEYMQYYPINIKGFSVLNENYESAIVDVETSPFKIDALDNTATLKFIKDTVFLQSIVRGEKSLLHLKDINSKNHLYIIDNQKYQPLIYKQYYATHAKKDKLVAENTRYKQMLWLYFQDCPGIKPKINLIRKYDVAPIKKVFDHYYECTNKTVAHTDERKEGTLEFGFTAGAVVTDLKFEGPLSYLTDVDYKPATTPFFGFFCDVKILRSMGWRVSNDILYTLFNVKGQGPGGGNGAYYADNAFNYHYLKTHHMLQINLLQKPVIYVSAGLSTGFILKDHFQVRVVYMDGRTSKRQFQSRKSEFGLLGGLGIRVKKWNAEARYENSTGVSNFHQAASQTTRILFLIKYRLRD